MQIEVSADMCVTFYHKQTLKELSIDQHISQKYNEDSEEYLSLCRELENDIGFPRKEDKERFDRLLGEWLCKEIKSVWDSRLGDIMEVVKKSFLDTDTTGIVTIGGYMLNLKDFCAVGVNAFEIKVNKS